MKKYFLITFCFFFSSIFSQEQECDIYIDQMTKEIEKGNINEAKISMKYYISCKEENTVKVDENINRIKEIQYFTRFNKEGYALAKWIDGHIEVIDLHFNTVKLLDNVLSVHSPFSEKYAKVQFKNEKNGYIDKNGKELKLLNVEKYDAYTPFSYGKAIVGFGNSYGVIDESGNITFKINENQDIWLEKILSNNVVEFVVDSRRKYLYNQGVGLLDVDNNKVLIDPKTNRYDALIDFNSQKNLVMLGVFNQNESCYGDSKAKVSVIDFTNNKFMLKDNCLAYKIGKSQYILRNEDKMQIYSLKNNTFFNNEKFDRYEPFQMSDLYFKKNKKYFLGIKKNDKWGGIILNKDFEITKYVSPNYDNIILENNFFIVRNNDKKGLTDVDGNIIIPIEFDELSNLKDGKVFYCRKNNPFQEYNYYVNEAGEITKKMKK